MDSREVWRQIGILLALLVVSILITLLPDWGQFQFSKSDEVFFGLLLFNVGLLIDVVFLVNRIAIRGKQEEALWLLREPCDAELLNVSRCFTRIAREAYGTRDLFVAHFKREIHELAENISEVADRRQLRVQADHFLNVDNVLDAFHSQGERIWRYTWAVDGSQPLFDELAWKRYFERTATMVEGGAIKEARIILVVPNKGTATHPRVQKLLDFFHTNKNFNCCLVNRDHFQTLCVDNGVPGSYIDFGIYGDRLLFLTEQYEPEIVGVFTKAPDQIQHYCSLFDSMWGSPSVARRNPSTATQQVQLADLYDFDETFQGPSAEREHV